MLALAFGSMLWFLILFPTLTILVVFLVIAWRTPNEADSTYNGYSLLPIYYLELELHQGLQCLRPPHPFLQQRQLPLSLQPLY